MTAPLTHFFFAALRLAFFLVAFFLPALRLAFFLVAFFLVAFFFAAFLRAFFLAMGFFLLFNLWHSELDVTLTVHINHSQQKSCLAT